MERTLKSRVGFQGRLLTVEVLDVELDDGLRSTREIVRHPGAAVVLGQLDDGRFVLVRQFRKTAEAELLEVVAGTLKPGEDPDACARREAEEETGYAVAGLRKLGVVHPAPGYTDERLHTYYARLVPGSGAARPDEDERIDVVRMTGGEINAAIREGRLVDAKSLAAWVLFEKQMGGAPAA